MSDVDRQRWAAVKHLTDLGFAWRDGQWSQASKSEKNEIYMSADFVAAADALHAEILGQCEDLAGATEQSEEEDRLARLGDLLDAYEQSRPKL